jgi:hypothetical protein
MFNLIGKSAQNPMLDTRMYVVAFPDGKEAEYTANVIAENIMIARCDDEGNCHRFMSHIVDHMRDHNAVTKTDTRMPMNL